MMIYYLEKCLSFFCCLLPERVCETVGRALGSLTWPLVPAKRRKMATDNVVQCLGVSETEAERIAKASWVRFGPMAFEVLRFPKLKGRLNERVELEGLDEVKKILALGRGVVFATSHCGNWELLGGALAEAGVPLVAVGMKQKETMYYQRHYLGIWLDNGWVEKPAGYGKYKLTENGIVVINTFYAD